MYLVTHGDHGTSVSDKIDQKTKNVVNTRFFLRIFFSAHFDHRKLRKSFMGGWWWWWYIPIIESALGPDLESRERE